MSNIYKQAMDFTLLVERFIRSDLPDGMKPATEGEVVSAMYWLRSQIPHVTRNTEEIDYARAWNVEARDNDALRKELAEMADSLRWALFREPARDSEDYYARAVACLAKYDEAQVE